MFSQLDDNIMHTSAFFCFHLRQQQFGQAVTIKDANHKAGFSWNMLYPIKQMRHAIFSNKFFNRKGGGRGEGATLCR